MDMFLIGAVVFFLMNLVVFGLMISRIDLENPTLVKNEQAARAERRELRRQRILKEQNIQVTASINSVPSQVVSN